MDCENVLKNTRQFRAKRSDHIDEEQHRKHNKQATRLWRQRLAYKEQLFDNVSCPLEELLNYGGINLSGILRLTS